MTKWADNEQTMHICALSVIQQFIGWYHAFALKVPCKWKLQFCFELGSSLQDYFSTPIPNIVAVAYLNPINIFSGFVLQLVKQAENATLAVAWQATSLRWAPAARDLRTCKGTGKLNLGHWVTRGTMPWELLRWVLEAFRPLASWRFLDNGELPLKLDLNNGQHFSILIFTVNVMRWAYGGAAGCNGGNADAGVTGAPQFENFSRSGV